MSDPWAWWAIGRPKKPAKPMVAMALSTLFEGYQWSLLAGGGAALAMAGLLVALSGRK